MSIVLRHKVVAELGEPCTEEFLCLPEFHPDHYTTAPLNARDLAWLQVIDDELQVLRPRSDERAVWNFVQKLKQRLGMYCRIGVDGLPAD